MTKDRLVDAELLHGMVRDDCLKPSCKERIDEHILEVETASKRLPSFGTSLPVHAVAEPLFKQTRSV
jgi:hypothetical protein